MPQYHLGSNRNEPNALETGKFYGLCLIFENRSKRGLGPSINSERLLVSGKNIKNVSQS